MKKNKSISLDLETLIPILIGVWRRLLKISGPGHELQTREFRSVVAAVEKLRQRFEGGKSLIGHDYFADKELLGAYLLYNWIVHYQQGVSLLGELPTKPKRVLDVCSGPAAFAFAALRHGAQEVIATDKNQLALDMGAEICGRYGMPLTVRPWDCLKNPCPVTGKFDLIILGHSLEDLFPDEKGTEKPLKLMNYLLELLSPKGYLLLVDDSHLAANRRLLQLRDQLVKEGVPVQAPCVWKGECPALKTTNSPCYAQREFEKPYLVKEIQRAASINLGSLKMSYIIFRSPKADWPELGDKRLYRIISPPIESFQGSRYYMCGIDGKKQLGSHLQTYPKESRAFEHLKRGELISIEDALENREALDIIKETRLQVEAACGKPLPEFFTND